MRKKAVFLAGLIAVGCRAGTVATRPAVAATPTAAPAPAATRLEDDRFARIEAILEEKRREQHIPGLAFAVVQDDRVLWMTGLGLRDVEAGLPATPDTVFPIGSCTKSFTSMAAGIAQDEGLLSLDDPPRKFLPGFRMADPDADAHVTLRDMLSHRTGLKANADVAAEPGVLTREEYVRAAASAKPAVKFRSAFQYSNAMFTGVGEIVGRVYGSTWEEAIAKKVFGPLGMTSSLATARDTARAANHATGYVYEKETWSAVAPPATLKTMAPAGSIASTARDMTRWLRMIASGGRLGEKRIVSEATLRELTTEHSSVNATVSYGLGWALYDWNGHRVVEHNGGSRGISAVMSIIPERRAGFVFLANTSPNFMTRIGNAGKLLWPLILGESAPSATAPAPTPPRSEPSPTPAAAGTAGTLPGADALLARMVRAAGGRRNLERHRSLEMHAVKSYANQGVDADLTVRAMAPAKRVEEEVWRAAGRELARLRVYFDGVRGGQETTFGQDSINAAADNERARRDDAFPELLFLSRLYREVRVQSRTKVGEEDAYVMELSPPEGPPVRLFVSARTALILRREVGGSSIAYEDYRRVDGEAVPYRATIQDELGETTIRVDRVRFNTAIPDDAFGPKKR